MLRLRKHCVRALTIVALGGLVILTSDSTCLLSPIGGSGSENAAPLTFFHLLDKEHLINAVQHLTHGRVLPVAARLQKAVWGPNDSSGLPAGGGRSDQRRRLSRPLAGARAQGSGGARLG